MKKEKDKKQALFSFLAKVNDTLFKSVIIFLVSNFLYYSDYAIAGSYGTTSASGPTCYPINLKGFSSIEEAGQAAWNNSASWNCPPTKGYTYGGIVEDNNPPHPRYWWGFNTSNPGYTGGNPYKYYSIGYNPDSYILLESPQDSSCGDKEGNPCNPANGNKIQIFLDYEPSNDSGLVVKRTYLSQTNTLNQFVSRWQHNFGAAMNPKKRKPSIFLSSTGGYNNTSANSSGLQQSKFYDSANDACHLGWSKIKNKAFRGILTNTESQYTGGNLCHILREGQVITILTIKVSGLGSFDTQPIVPVNRVVRSDGSQYLFQQQGTEWKDQDHPEASLISQGTNWLLTDAKDNQELFDEQGRLIQMITRKGQVTNLQHDLTVPEGGDDKSETLDKVIGPFGRSLKFSYQDSDGKLASVNTPDGLIQYSYDTAENLTQVTYPDGKTETYHYEKTAFPHHLTGITNEKGIRFRFATWDYDDQGRAILSEHADHTEKVTFVYNADGTTTVTGAMGDTRIYHFDWIKGGLKVKKITGDRCASCGNGHMKERSYDDNGFLSSYIDWNGNITTYTRDSTGLELTRTEASGTAEAKTITTEWHSDFRVPIKVTQGNRITEYSYDAQGRLLSTTIRNVQ